jgi:hypothetical protein
MKQLPFIEFARFYLPGLLPIVVIVSLIITRFPINLWAELLVLAIVVSLSLYLHTALGEPVISLIARFTDPQEIPRQLIPPKFAPP